MKTHAFPRIRYEFCPGLEVIPYMTPHEARRLFGGAKVRPSHAHGARPMSHGHAPRATWRARRMQPRPCRRSAGTAVDIPAGARCSTSAAAPVRRLGAADRRLLVLARARVRDPAAASSRRRHARGLPRDRAPQVGDRRRRRASSARARAAAARDLDGLASQIDDGDPRPQAQRGDPADDGAHGPQARRAGGRVIGAIR